jgi:Domain of unknown function (DUF4249)
MKNTHTYTIAFALLVMSVSACTPEPIPIFLDEIESQLVTWSQAIPNNTTVVYLARSFSALEYQENGNNTDTTGNDELSQLLQQFLATNALVVITHNNQPDTLFQVSDGVWASFSTELVAGDTYHLFAYDNATNKSINAETRMYAAVPLDTVLYSVVDTSTVDFQVQFQDPPGPNWYAIHFYSNYANPLVVEDPLAASNVVETALLSDIELNSGNVTIQKTLEFLDSDTLYISLNNISEQYYNYLGQRDRGGSIYNQLIQEPINYVSNVQGGYGMFTLNAPSIRQVIIE